MKRKYTILAVLLVLVMSGLTGCGRYEQMRITSGAVESMSLNGLRSVDLELAVGVDNPAGKVVLQEMTGVVKCFGKVIGRVATVSPLTIEKKTQAEYDVTVRVSLEQGMSMMQLMSLVSKETLKDCTVDVSLVGKVSGVRMKKKYNDIPLIKLMQ